jgi:hypothetical protein
MYNLALLIKNKCKDETLSHIESASFQKIYISKLFEKSK